MDNRHACTVCRDAYDAGAAGLICREYSTDYFMPALGADIVCKDENDLPYPADSSALYEAFRSVFELMYDDAVEVEFQGDSRPLARLRCRGSLRTGARAVL